MQPRQPDEIRRIRRRKGSTGVELASRIKELFGVSFSQSKLSKIETLAATATVRDVEFICGALDVDSDTKRRLKDLADSIQVDAATWRNIQSGSTERHQHQILDLERNSDRVEVLQRGSPNHAKQLFQIE